jgi:predicted acetyltransferase
MNHPVSGSEKTSADQSSRNEKGLAMNTTTVRRLEGDEMLDVLYTLTQYSLHPSPPFQNKEEWLSIVRDRKGLTCCAAFEDGVPVSIAVSTAMTQNMRGRLFSASGVWGVATDPAARRKGYCRQAITALLAAEHESGKAFSNLYPFRESFYERMGYVAFPLTRIAKFSPLALAPLMKMDSSGNLDLKLVGEVYDTYRLFLADMRISRHGMGFFDFGVKATADRANLWAATVWFDGQVEGLMLYRLQGAEPTKYNFQAVRFYYKSSRARYRMLEWIARHADQAERVELWLSPEEYPETWLADLEVKMESAARPAMNRVLDVEKLSGMHVGEGSFTARVNDPICPWNEGPWNFTGRDGMLHVTRTSAADCTLTVQGLSALVAGTHDPDDLPLRGWGDAGPKILSIQRRMFPRLVPFLHENF